MSARISILIIFVFFSCGFLAYAQTPDPGQTSGGILRQDEAIDRGLRLEKQITTTPVKPPIETMDQKPAPTADRRILIETVLVEDVTLLPQEEIKKITSVYEYQELSMGDMQKIADRITEAYRKKGYVTSRAYIPAQSINDGILRIKVLEVKTGSINVRGIRYSKLDRFKRNLGIYPGEYFDFSAMKKSLVLINEHPDRMAKAVLIPGQEPGTTDIVVDVAERRPFHAGFEYDNYGSRFIGQHRYSLVLEHNNLLGFDDLFYLKGQLSHDSQLIMEQLRYLFPLTLRWDVGFYAVNSAVTLGKEFESLDAEGRAQVLGIFTGYKLIKEEDLALNVNFGFDYKSVRNEIVGVETSHDELRILKAGFDLDIQDPLGRNILAMELDSGLSDVLGASEDKDPDASRMGAGGRFDKGIFTYYRLQPMPLESSVLWKNIAQFSNHNLTASEQFQIGGALSVRGYPPAEYSGDSGLYSSLEWSFPVYPLSKNRLVPFTKDVKLYDALRLVVFYDIASTYLNNPLAGEEDAETLRGVGAGVRLNVKDNLTLRFEVGYPLGAKPSDGDRAHPWIEFTSKY